MVLNERENEKKKRKKNLAPRKAKEGVGEQLALMERRSRGAPAGAHTGEQWPT
jgi:hypothetical protein